MLEILVRFEFGIRDTGGERVIGILPVAVVYNEADGEGFTEPIRIKAPDGEFIFCGSDECLGVPMTDGQGDVGIDLDGLVQAWPGWLIAGPAADFISECGGAPLFFGLSKWHQFDGALVKLDGV